MRTTFVQALFVQLGLSISLDGLTRRTDSIGAYNIPEVTSFLQLDLAISIPSNVSTPDGVTALAPNAQGGKTSGAFEAEILPVGAAYERVVVNQAGENSFYNNRYIFQTANNETISLEVDVILKYENNALHGFGSGKFATTIPDLFYLNYNSYLVEVSGDFTTGEAAGQVFALKSGGRRDGKPINALLPPGGD
ncbi:hypothetical protein FSARC_14514 [Fusarium sarcochroum]|uniref:Uncharacterized protein n=1 Tax=Fusarium sarcochroum TaxID=1208366 RepID=A0A8H4WP28_9HYPO|nr:hypothetical protein FSARC_14514 [Fusarium sarcochroum]